ncbi:MAG: carbohydrate ABC transporter permease [Acholeplasmataceae bacterium]|jgi:ABC-type glycerol-3-phosphate transport system permease component|nr:carbohydrate ABC transporter permease [Acholeplasmataceae bacterium]MDD4468968.1 carbohydrate ABC transporter permease [Acholeplasmataceae bacterium]MDD4824576.1 carbohydrate ABC transporter permease [Acholeplasmataceae bacterium]
MARNSLQGTKINPKRFHRSQIKFYLILIPVAIFMALPIVYIFNHAFKPIDELFAWPPRFFVRRPTFNNFLELFAVAGESNVPVFRYLFNSIVITASVVLISIVVSSMAGYALSKLKFKFKKEILFMNNIALMFVGASVAIPRYLVIENLGLIDNFWVHIFPVLAVPVGLFLIKQFIDQIPNDLIEAAKIDGASQLRVFWSIILPLIKPAIATIAIVSFQSVWNDAGISTTYIDRESLKTFAYYMSTLLSSGNVVAGQGISAAGSLIMFLPNLIIFIFMQGKVMNTMAHSGIK